MRYTVEDGQLPGAPSQYLNDGVSSSRIDNNLNVNETLITIEISDISFFYFFILTSQMVFKLN